MAICVAVIGKRNHLQFIACSNPEKELHLHYYIHSCMDIVEEKFCNLVSSKKRKLYIGLINSTEEYKLYSYVTNTDIKFIIVCEVADKSLRENDIQSMFGKLHDSYVDTVSNPFYIPGEPIVSRRFSSAVNGILSGSL